MSKRVMMSGADHVEHFHQGESVYLQGWEVQIVADEDGFLNIDVRHSDGTDVVDTGECPGAGEDEGAIGFRLTTDGITEMYRDE